MNAPLQPTGECPSRYRLDRHLSGELPSEDAQRLEQHAASCARCRPLLASLREAQRSFAALPDAVRLRAQAQTHASTPTVREARGWWLGLGGLATAAAMALAIAVWPGAPASDGVRSKGGAQLLFHVQHAGAVREGVDGERVVPGDALRFSYRSERDAYLAILSIDGAGRASAYHAQDGRAAPIGTSARATLPHSTVLDDALGREHVYGLFCDRPLELAPLLRALERAPEQPPRAEGCVVERYTLRKEPR